MHYMKHGECLQCFILHANIEMLITALDDHVTLASR